MTQKVKRIVALILSMLMILSSVTVYAADDNTDTQPTGHILTVNVAGEGYVEVNGEGMQLSSIMLDSVMQLTTFLMPDYPELTLEDSKILEADIMREIPPVNTAASSRTSVGWEAAKKEKDLLMCQLFLKENGSDRR